MPDIPVLPLLCIRQRLYPRRLFEHRLIGRLKRNNLLMFLTQFSQIFVNTNSLIIQIAEIINPVPFIRHIRLHTQAEILKRAQNPFPRPVNQRSNLCSKQYAKLIRLLTRPFRLFQKLSPHTVKGILIFQDQQILRHLPGMRIISHRLRRLKHIQGFRFQTAVLQDPLSLLP